MNAPLLRFVKVFFAFVFLFFVMAKTADAATYYLAPTGNDANACTLTAPCFTLQKAWTLIAPGDTVYLRGGTYTYTKQQGLTGKNGTSTNTIKVWAYPGETPVITRPATGYTSDIYWHRSGIFFTGNYVHFKGLEITGYKNINGNVEDGLLAYDSNNNIFEQLNIHHNFHGMYIENNSSNNLVLNSDFHDNYTDYNGGGDSDGIGISYNTGANNVIQGCRAWNNGDDGFDTFEAKGLVTIKDSWAWHNGYQYGTSTPAGNGVGFKLGSNFLQGTTLQNTVVRIVQNTISADNRDSGYHINEGDHRAILYNNVSYGNKVMGLNFHWNNLVHTFKNNVSFGNGSTQVEISANSISSNNSYGIGGYSDGGVGWAATASTADFVSTDISQFALPRQADGSLPAITAFTLAAGSDLINAGTNVGLPYSGSAPDIGAFEYTGATTTIDTTAPSVPAGLSASGTTQTQTTLTWTASTDNIGVTGYKVYRSGTQIGTTTTPSYTATGLTAATPYTFTVAAYDAAGNNSAQSAALAVTTTGTTNTPPVANAGADQTITLPTNSVTLTGSGTDAGGSIVAYAWTKISTLAGTITSPTSATTTITGLVQGAHTFRLTVTDNGGLTATDDVVIVVNAATTAGGNTYYLSPAGNDANACTLTAPCFTLKRAWNLIAAGDTVYMRGGTYAYSSMQYLQGKNGTAGNLIKIWAYPGETPIITRSASYAIVNGVDQDLIYLEGNYFHFKGLEIAYFVQKPNEAAYPAFRAGFTSGSIFENINYHHNMSGFQIRGNSTGNLILNSDFHHNQDPYGATPYDGADGLNITFNYDPNSVNTIRGSRAYWNADDGFDTWENQGSVVIENSWSFFNGYIPDTFTTAGNGTAFKLGSVSTPSTQTKRLLKNNLAYKNRFAGFVENNAGVKMELYNNTSINAGYSGYWFGAWGTNGNVTVAKNNLDYQAGNVPGPFNSASSTTNNSWQNNITVTNADFVTMTDSQLMGARQADGSLPAITAFTLAAGSDLINAGTNVGLPYSGSAPDIGAFEYTGTTPPPTGDTTAPIVAFTAPAANVTLSGTATLSATASDNIGVTKVEFYNGATLVATDTTSPYSATLDTTTLSNGAYTLSAKAYDAAGNVGTATVGVTVTNATTGSGVFALNDRVQVYGGSARVRASASTSGSVLGTQSIGKLGTIIGGPVSANGYIWWNVNFDTSPDGWVIQNRLRLYTAPTLDTTAPSVPAGLSASGTTQTQTTLTWTASTDNIGVTGYKVYRSGTQIGTTTTPSYTATGLTAATPYTFTVAAYDAAGNNSAQSAALAVTTTGTTNTPPVANAGADQTITLPTNSVTLTGSGTDAGGSIVAYAWTQVSGPTSATITTPAAAMTTVSNLAQGTYSFWLTVTDNNGATNADAVFVIVNPAVVVQNLILTASAINDAGYAYRISQSFGIPADIATNPTQSRLRVFENGVELTQAHADHGQIEALGAGRFSHWMDEFGYEALYLSTSDNTDPRTNGRTYTFRTDGTAVPVGTTGFSDSFTRANDTALGTGWTERGAGSNLSINANAVVLDTNNTTIISAHTTNGISSANYTVQSKISFPTIGQSIMYAGISGRRIDVGSADSGGYMVYVEPYDSILTLYKRVGGNWTRLGEYQLSLVANTQYTIGLSMNGNTIKALWQGNPVITVADNSFTQAGSAGLITGDGHSMTGVRWDDFSVTQ